MADFDKFAPLLRRLEAGFSDHPDDKGGATMDGVTLRVFREHYGQSRTADDLKAITPEQWRHIMKTGYWDRCSADRISSQSVAEITADWCVNSGPVAIRKVQELVDVRPDGIAGAQTIAGINARNPRELFDRIKSARRQFYTAIVRRNPRQRVFMPGWMNRLEQFSFKG